MMVRIPRIAVCRPNVYIKRNIVINTAIGREFSSINRVRMKSKQPWFVEEDPTKELKSELFSRIQTTHTEQQPKHIERPSHVPEFLNSLHKEMVTSPFIDPKSVSFIDCKAADPDARLNWVVVGTLKSDRLSASRGAAERVRSFLKENKQEIEDGLYFMQEPKVVGTQRSANMNALRRKSMKRRFLKIDEANEPAPNQFSWALVDATPLNVHIMSPMAREYFDLDDLWKRIANGKAFDDSFR